MPIKISLKTIDEELQRKVREISGQNFSKCFQCGTCAGSCPMVEHLTAVPRKVMALLQLGQADALSEANTPWVGASCHTCMVRCPRGIDLPKVMEALRQLKLRENVDRVPPASLGAEVLTDAPQIAMVSCFRKLTS